MNKYLPIIIILGQQIFFSTSSILGFQYQGSETTNIYIYYNFFIFIIAILIYIHHIIKDKISFLENILVIPYFFTFSILIEYFIGNLNFNSFIYYLYFLLWGLPAIFMGIYINNKKNYNYIFKSLEIVVIIFSFATIRMIYKVLILSEAASIGGSSYQYSGYIIALTFGLNLFFLLNNKFTLLKKKLYKNLFFLFSIVHIVGVLITGARGPVVLLIFYFVVLMIDSMKEKKTIIRFISLFIFLFILYTLFGNKLLLIKSFSNGLKRAFSYITPSGINFGATSGRDILYLRAINYIKESPIYGYGIFSMFNTFGKYPHNIFLEVLMQGGVIYFSIFILIGLYFIKRLFFLIKLNSDLKIILILFIYQITLLMFSGTYLNHSIFWFCLSIVFTYKKTNRV